MSLRKRPRPPMRRTASMAGLPVDRIQSESSELSVPRRRDRRPAAAATAAPPRKRHTVDLVAVETAQFLRACGLCDRRLGPGRDTFIYRGDIAFCSLECREQQISHDERMEKCLLASMKTETPMTTAGSEAPGNGETAVAA